MVRGFKFIFLFLFFFEMYSCIVFEFGFMKRFLGMVLFNFFFVNGEIEVFKVEIFCLRFRSCLELEVG